MKRFKKILQSDLLILFGLHLNNKIFHRYEIYVGTQQIIQIFIIEQIQWKLITNFFKIKKALFLVHFLNFWGNKSFQKIRLCHTELDKGL